MYVALPLLCGKGPRTTILWDLDVRALPLFYGEGPRTLFCGLCYMICPHYDSSSCSSYTVVLMYMTAIASYTIPFCFTYIIFSAWEDSILGNAIYMKAIASNTVPFCVTSTPSSLLEKIAFSVTLHIYMTAIVSHAVPFCVTYTPSCLRRWHAC